MAKIEKANKEDSDALTEIAFSAKKHWRYPNEYFDIWRSELTITDKYIEQNFVYKAILDSKIVGFYSLVHVKQDNSSGKIKIPRGWWLDHIFILPEFHGRGIGSMLISHSKNILQQNLGNEYHIFVDPFAIPFYEKIGAQFLYNSPSSIENRELPVYKVVVN